MATNPSWRKAVETLQSDLRATLGERLQALVVYEAHGAFGEPPDGGSEARGLRHRDRVHTLAIVDGLGPDDLARLAPLSPKWAKHGLAVPLVLAPSELARSFDAFPLELGQILARHEVVAGDDPFRGFAVDADDLRRACEAQARSHVIHLREGFLEAGGSPHKINDLVAASVVPLRALLVNVARLHGVDTLTPADLSTFVEHRLGLPMAGLRPLLAARSADRRETTDAGALFPAYLQAVERLAQLVDEWTR